MSPPADPVDVEELERLLNAATPGPWRWWTSNSHARLSSDATGKDGDVISAIIAFDGAPVLAVREVDQRAIAAMRNTLPSLLAEVRRLRQEVERWRDEAVVATSNVVVADKERDSARAEGERLRGALTALVDALDRYARGQADERSAPLAGVIDRSRVATALDIARAALEGK